MNCLWCGDEVGPDKLWCDPCWKIRKARPEKPADPWEMPEAAKLAKAEAKRQKLIDRVTDLFPETKGAHP